MSEYQLGLMKEAVSEENRKELEKLTSEINEIELRAKSKIIQVLDDMIKDREKFLREH
ncbi:MAG: hypothetical protein Q8L52_02165 [bacterium]|nr:hypothetical protein [bacterium]